MNRRFRWTLAAALLAVVAVAVAMLPSRAAVGPTSPAARFSYEMMQHHLQAVDMATRIRERTDDERLRTLALDIVLSQTDQVGQMRGWLSVWGLPWSGPGMSGEHARAMGMATQQQVEALSTLPVAEAEREFLRLMIRHHRGAVDMTRDVLDARAPDVVQTLARQIHDAQAGEIRLMTGMLAARGGTTDSPGETHDHDSPGTTHQH